MTPQENWARCRPWVEAAIATSAGFETVEDVENLVAKGSYQVFFGDNCVAITEICDYLQRKVLVVQHGGGDLDELLDVLEPRMAGWAQEQDCDAIMGLGRRGWERVTEKRGYRLAYVAMIKDLRQ